MPVAVLNDEDLAFLTRLTRDVTEACKVYPGQEAAQGVKNELPFPGVRPGGRDCYPAIWVQDFTMIFFGGALPAEDGLNHLRLFLGCQNGERKRTLQHGASIPPYAIPDHVRFDGQPVFFPGTYSAGEDQGGEPWGLIPPMNNHFDVIWLAHMLCERAGNHGLLEEAVDGVSVYERLKLAYSAPTVDSSTGLAVTTPEDRAVGFIFCDSVYMTGSLLMASLLRVRASRQMAELAGAIGRHADAAFFTEQAALPLPHLLDTFACEDEHGLWLRASTGVSAQPDVWGSAYAVYLGAVRGEAADRVVRTLAAALRAGTIESDGALRHIPLDHDASPGSAWERTRTRYNRYQNGAYWPMPTGWLISILAKREPALAAGLMRRFIDHLRAHEFTQGDGYGAPWECVGWGGEAEQNSVFGPSITVPTAVLASEGAADR